MSDPSTDDASAGHAWDELLGVLGSLPSRMTELGFPSDGAAGEESLRHLARQVGLALQGELEHADVPPPALHRYELPWSQWGAPNPDNVYLRCAIDPTATYVLRGHVAGVHEALFSLVEGDMHLDENGVFAEVALTDLRRRTPTDALRADRSAPTTGAGNHLASDARRPAAAHPPVPLRLGRRAGRVVHDRADRHRRRAGAAADSAPTSPPRSTGRPRWVERSIDYWAAYVAASRDLLEHNTFTAAEHAARRRAEHRLRRRLLGPRRRTRRCVIEHDAPDAHYWNWSIHHLHWFDSGAWDQRPDELQRPPGPRRRRRQGPPGRRRTPTRACPTGSTPRASRSAWPCTATSARARSPQPAARVAPLDRAPRLLPAGPPGRRPEQRRRPARRSLAGRAAALELSRMTVERPHPTRWLVRLNAHADAVGGAEHLVSLDPEDCSQAVRTQSTGLDDFGGDTWRPHFEVLVEALAHRGPPHRWPAGSWPAPSCCGRCASGCCSPRPGPPTRRSSTSRSTRRCSSSAPAGRARRSCTSCSRSTPPTGCRSPGSCSTRARRSARTPSRARRAGHDVHAFWADLQPGLRDDAPQRRRRAERVHLRHDARVPLRPVGRHLRGPDLLRRTLAAATTPRPTGTTARCCRRCSAATAATAGCSRRRATSRQLRTLFAVYPDARVVQIHRDPLKTVPSTISLMGTIRSMRSSEVDVDTARAVDLARLRLHARRHVMDARDRGELPDAQFVDVRYADLMRDPVDDAARTSTARIDVEPPADLADAVTSHLSARPKGVHGAHRYSLADTGLDEVAERARFERYAARYSVPEET